MVQSVRETLPAMREVLVAGDRTAAGMTRLADLLEDRIEDRRALASLDRLRPVIPRTHDDYLYNSLASAQAAAVDGDSVLLISVPVAQR